MQNTSVPKKAAQPSVSAVHLARNGVASGNGSAPDEPSDRQFMAMLDSYRGNGGLARAQEVFTMYKAHHGTDATMLARWIVKRDLISFDWQSCVWVPLFQFDRMHMTLQPGLSNILSALRPVFESWEMAIWFARPNHRLSGRTPGDVVCVNAQAVLMAACADRFTTA